ncbi:MAG: hypothetical protein GC160_07060 [Acidobacteria bacterium]|nr:hypothetical protein [Acidobacteriota bacterium]
MNWISRALLASFLVCGGAAPSEGSSFVLAAPSPSTSSQPSGAPASTAGEPADEPVIPGLHGNSELLSVPPSGPCEAAPCAETPEAFAAGGLDAEEPGLADWQIPDGSLRLDAEIIHWFEPQALLEAARRQPPGSL